MRSDLDPLTFVERLDAHGGRLAVVAPDGELLRYRDLAARVSDMRDRLGGERRLILLAAANDVDTLVTYLAALRGGHPVLLAAPGDGFDTLAHRYDPDVIARRAGSWLIDERRARSAHALHPELALLLSTSGSTGSPKLVRLSRTNLAANAAAIAGYLGIRDTDRAAATLPVHYCYGLSVVNSNLLSGAALLLSDRSVTDPDFWAAFREHDGTSLHGVPYTFELLDGAGFPDMVLPRLRYVTQAGGRLAPQTVRRYAELGARQGWELFVMYGQTEATARMAYLPPERAAGNPSAIGVPIPGGSFEIDDADGTGAGELVYRGPNVMLGYAEHPDDLADGRTVDALRTGDVARRAPDGLYEIVGRRNRIVKPYGLRIDLERVERLLADEGCTATCAGDDQELVVAVTGAPNHDRVRRFVTEGVGLASAAVRVVDVAVFPRRVNGKIDHHALGELVRASRPRPGRWRPARPRSVREAFRAVFALPDLPDEATFVSLGGDSLSWVRMTVELQRVLGHLPAGWDTTPISTLERQSRRTRSWTTVETGVLIRAVAIVLVVGAHVGLFEVRGGAHLLLGVAGWAFARFVLAPGAHRPGGPSRAILRSLGRIAVPAALWIAWRAAVEDDVDLVNVALLNQFLDPTALGYWYVETLSHTLLLLVVVFAIPAVHRLERWYPFGFAVALLLVAQIGRLFPDAGNAFSDRQMSTHLAFWLFVLGWVVQRADTRARQAAVAGLVVLLVPGFSDNPLRAAVVTVGLLLLLLAPRIAVPRPVARPVGVVAGASLAIYLTHYAVYPALLPHLPPLPVAVACVGTGILAWSAVTSGTRWLAGALSHTSPGAAARPGAAVEAIGPSTRSAARGGPDIRDGATGGGDPVPGSRATVVSSSTSRRKYK